MKDTSFLFVLQARNGSTRLPEKVTKSFSGNQSILEIVISRLKHSFPQIPLVLATTISKDDDLVVKQSEGLDAKVYRGSENDVLNRMVEASSTFSPRYVIRVCCDNPFLDTNLIQDLIDTVKLNPEKDYYSHFLNEDLPVIKSHLGVFAEVASFNTLKQLDSRPVDSFYREHVTNYLYESGEYDLHKVILPQFLRSFSDYRLTVDDSTDFELAQELWPIYQKNNQNLELFLNEISNSDVWINTMHQQISKYKK
jgi:spore coat polysaccharide biosynthesis protein SpsF